MLYFLAFYFVFMQNAFSMMGNYSSLARMNVTISTVNYEVTVADSDAFFKVFNLSDRSLQSLIDTGCFINGYNNGPDYGSGALALTYQFYTIMGLLIMCTSVLI